MTNRLKRAVTPLFVAAIFASLIGVMVFAMFSETMCPPTVTQADATVTGVDRTGGAFFLLASYDLVVTLPDGRTINVNAPPGLSSPELKKLIGTNVTIEIKQPCNGSPRYKVTTIPNTERR